MNMKNFLFTAALSSSLIISNAYAAEEAADAAAAANAEVVVQADADAAEANLTPITFDATTNQFIIGKEKFSKIKEFIAYTTENKDKLDDISDNELNKAFVAIKENKLSKDEAKTVFQQYYSDVDATFVGKIVDKIFTESTIDAEGNLVYKDQKVIKIINLLKRADEDDVSEDDASIEKQMELADILEVEEIPYANGSKIKLADLEKVQQLTELAAAEQTDATKQQITALRKELAETKALVTYYKTSAAEKALVEKIADIEEAQENKNEANIKAAVAELKQIGEVLLVTDSKSITNVQDLPSVQKPDTAISEGILGGALATRSVIDSRVANFSGVASGELMENYGVWIKGAFTKGNQKSYKKRAGFGFSQKGVTIGFDSGDESMAGFAYSFNKNDITSKEVKTDKSDATTHTFSLYGKYQLDSQMFVNGQLQYGHSKIKIKRETTATKATAKTKGKTMAGKIEFGYDYAVNGNVHVLPTLGVAHTSVKIDAYKEKGAGLLRSVNKGEATRTSGIAGVSVKFLSAATGFDMDVLPEIHANIDYGFKTKNADTVIKLFDQGESYTTPVEKGQKLYWNVGASVKTINSDMYEVSLGYDLGAAKKFMSHTGALKLRVNL